MMMKCCALIACKVFAIMQTSIISMCMLQKQFACRWENQIKCRIMRKIAYKNHSIQHLVIVMIKTETKHSCIWFVESD